MASEPVAANPGKLPAFATGSCPALCGAEPRGGSRVTPYRCLPGAARRDTPDGRFSFLQKCPMGRSSTGRAAISETVSYAGSNPVVLAILCRGLDFCNVHS